MSARFPVDVAARRMGPSRAAMTLREQYGLMVPQEREAEINAIRTIVDFAAPGVA